VNRTPKKHTPKKTRNRRSASIPPGLLQAAAIAALGIAVYSGTFDCPFQFDDYDNIVDNPAIRDIGDLGAIWGFIDRRFLGYLSFALNYHFHGLEVFGFHVVNLAVHLLASICAWRLARLLFATPAMKGTAIARHRGLIAFGCGLIFVAHPVQTQAVTYIVQRLASLAALFYLASVYCYVRGRLADSRFRPVFFAGSLAAGILGMFTKETVFTLPFAILLVEIFFLQENPRKALALFRRGRTYLFALPFAAFLLILPALLDFNMRAVTQPAASQRFLDPPLTSATYLFTQFRVIATYIRMLFVPVGQNIDHTVPAAVSFFEPRIIVSFIFLGAVFAGGAAAFRRYRTLSFGVMWFFLTLSIESSIKPLGNVMFEHRLYLPLFGFALFLPCAAYHLTAKRWRAAAVTAFALYIAILAAVTWRRNLVWETEIALWADAVEKSPDKARPHNNLGSAYQNAGRYLESLAEYRRAVEIHAGYAQAYSNMGAVKIALAENEEAVRDLRRAVELDGTLNIAWNNLGNALLELGRYDEAESSLRRSLKIRDDYAPAHNNLGLVHARRDDYETAEKHYLRALELDPDYPKGWNNYGIALAKQGDFEGAVAAFKRALSLDPALSSARNNLVNAYLSMGDLESAKRLMNR